jgi:hypothetical protein
MALVLARWGIPAEVYYPLKYAAESFAELSRLSEPIRTKVELLKIAIVLAEHAVERWSPWDHVELPPPPLLARHGLEQAGELIAEIRNDLSGLPRLGGLSENASPAKLSPRPDGKPLAYARLAAGSYDFLCPLTSSLGYDVRQVLPQADEWPAGLVLNGTGATAPALALPAALNKETLLVIDGPLPQAPSGIAPFPLPASIAAINAACERLSILNKGG